MFHTRISFLLVIAALALSAPALAQSRPSDVELAQALRAGGHVIVMRHGATHADQADTDPLNYDNVAKQRQLNAKGEEAAKAFGAAFKQIGVPVGKVVTSHFNRAYQTAKLAGFDNIEKSVDVTEGGLVVSPNENNRRAAAFRKLASTPPPAGTNVLDRHAQAQHDRRVRQGLVRGQGRRGDDLQAGWHRLQAGGAGADGRMAPHRRGREEMNRRSKR